MEVAEFMQKWSTDRETLRLMLNRELTTINHWCSDRPTPEDVKALLESYNTLLESIEDIRLKHPELFNIYVATLDLYRYRS